MNPIQPKEVITPQQCAEGYKWVYRGKGWKGVNVCYTCSNAGDIPAGSTNYHLSDTDAVPYLHYFEMVKDDTTTVTFKVIPWKVWKYNLINNLTQLVDDREISVRELIDAPKLDPEDIKDFCEHFAFDNVFEDNVFVEHCDDPTYVWFINNDKVILIKKP